MSQYDLPEGFKMTTGARLYYEQLVSGEKTPHQLKRKKVYLKSVYQEQKLADVVVALEIYKFYTDGLKTA